MSEPTETTPAPVRPRRALGWKAIVAIVIAVLALIIIFQNTADGEVRFLFWKASMPVWVWLFVMLVAGFVIGLLLGVVRRRKPKK